MVFILQFVDVVYHTDCFAQALGSLSADGWGCVCSHPAGCLFGLRHPSTGACRLFGGARSQCQKASATSVLAPPVSHS